MAAGEDQEMKRETRMVREENAIDVCPPPYNEQKETAIRDVRQRHIWTLKSAKIRRDLKLIEREGNREAVQIIEYLLKVRS